MFCPECRAEYVKGITECAECHVALVDRLPGVIDISKEQVELVTVLETTDRMAIMIARSILDGEGMNYLVDGDRMQDILGIGGTGLTPYRSPLRINVVKEDEADARILLEGIGNNELNY